MVVYHTSRSRRWFWLGLVFILVLLTLWAGGRARANDTQPATAEATGRVNLPIVLDTPPLTPKIRLVEFTKGFENKTITVITHARDERLFIANREGKVWIVRPSGEILEPPFLDISNRVRYQDNFEQGLLGLTFHPDYPAMPYFYILYTTPGHIEVARGSVDPVNPNLADPHSLQVFLRIKKPPRYADPEQDNIPSPVHNGGDLSFGPDGYLYIPLGDGGPDPYEVPELPGDPYNNSQNRANLLGSILRIDPDPARGLPPECGTSNLYSIPRDNPFLNDSGCGEVWVYGLRNPWRIAIDRPTGDFYIADVGEWEREEINFISVNSGGGHNFGWHCWEGTVDYTTIFPEVGPSCANVTNTVFPVFEYDHSHGECSIIGGKVYRGSKYPLFNGYYFFGDWCTGDLWSMIRRDGQWVVEPAGKVRILFTTFGEDLNGELYGAGYANGTLYKLVIE